MYIPGDCLCLVSSGVCLVVLPSYCLRCLGVEVCVCVCVCENSDGKLLHLQLLCDVARHVFQIVYTIII